MFSETEKAFREADRIARQLGSMKYGIYEVKTAGGVSELQKLEALMGFVEQAREILKNMSDSIAVAVDKVNRENKSGGVAVDNSLIPDSDTVNNNKHNDKQKNKDNGYLSMPII